MNLLVKGAWAQVIRRNENEPKDVKNHVFESFLLQQVSPVDADNIMNAFNTLAYGATEDERTAGFVSIPHSVHERSDTKSRFRSTSLQTLIVNLLVDGAAAKAELQKLARVPLKKDVPAENDVIGKLRQYLLKRIPASEADRIVNLFSRYLNAATLEEKREANVCIF